MSKEVLKITNDNLYNITLDGYTMEEVEINIKVNITSNEELSDIINSLRILRGALSKKKKR